MKIINAILQEQEKEEDGGTATAHTGKVVVEVHTPSTEVAAQQSGVRGEDGGNRDLLAPQDDEPDTSQPLMEVGYHHRRWARQTFHELITQMGIYTCTCIYMCISFHINLGGHD